MKYIYIVTNPLGVVYIGQTKNYIKRKCMYRSANCKTQYMLYNSIKKYGWDKHKFEVIAEVSEEYADDTEVLYIEYYKSYYKNGGMNLTLGGLSHGHSDDTRKKLSEAILGAKNVRAKKLYQYDLERNLLKEWSCMKDIERQLGYSTTSLTYSARYNTKLHGFMWSYHPL